MNAPRDGLTAHEREVMRMNRQKHREDMREWRDVRRENVREVLNLAEKLIVAINGLKAGREVNAWLWRALEATLASLDYLLLRLESEEKLSTTQILKKNASEKR